MQLLTPSGYKNIDDCVIGEKLVAYDIITGQVIENELLGKEWFSPDMFVDEYSETTYSTDENGDQVVNPPILLRTKEDVFKDLHGDLKFYTINGSWKLYSNQSVWANSNITHAHLLRVGDVIYSDNDSDITIDSITESVESGWWRLTVSGDHSYISDGLTLHNASRYWVGGGSDIVWAATGNTNWGSTSGGANNASVPTSVDDAIFDGVGTNANTASVISATTTIKSLTITTGYTSTMTHNAILTIAGNWNYSNTYTIAGTSAVTISTTTTITSNGKAWPNDLNFNGLVTATLSGNFSVTGLLTCINNAITINKTTTETITVAGGINIASTTGGTAKVVLTGGIWYSSSNISNDLDFNGNLTLYGIIYYVTGTMTYVSGTITTTASTLYIGISCTLNTNGVTWNNLTITAASGITVTLTSNLLVNGLLTIGILTNLNGSSYTATINGGVTCTAAIQGSSKLIIKGGTVTNGNLQISCDFNGNITFFGYNYLTGTGKVFTYIAGTVTTSGSQLDVFTGGCTWNLNGITWDNITFSNNGTFTLSSNLSCSGVVTVNGIITINKTTSETFTTSGGIIVNNNLFGTADLYLTGGTWYSQSTNVGIRNNLYINGNLKIVGTVGYLTGVMTYVSGTVSALGSSLYILGSTTLNTSGITFGDIVFSLTSTITLTSNITISGLLTVGVATTVNRTTSETIICNAGIYLTANVSGTAKIVLKGGNWYQSVKTSTIQNSLDLDGNVSIVGQVGYGSGTMTYVSGTINVSGCVLNLNSSFTMNTSSITWPSIFMEASNGVMTLTSDLNVTTLYIWANGGGAYFNKTVSEVVNVNNIKFFAGTIAGTSKIVLKGGSITSTNGNAASFAIDVDFNGDTTLPVGLMYVAGTTKKIKYLSGTITTTGNTLRAQTGITLDTNGMQWNNFFCPSQESYYLLSDLTINGTYNAQRQGAYPGDFSVYINGTYSHETDRTHQLYRIYFNNGSTWRSTVDAFGFGQLAADIYLNGNMTIQGNVYCIGTGYKNNGRINYVTGTITLTGSTIGIYNGTLNVPGLVLNNLNLYGTLTLQSSVSISGSLIQTAGGVAINKTTNETFTVAGGVILSVGNLSGTAKIILAGGSWVTNGVFSISNDIDFNGNVTIVKDAYYSGTMTYVSGTVNTSNSRLFVVNTTTFNLSGMSLNDVMVNGAYTITLLSNLVLTGSLSNNTGFTFPVTINGSSFSVTVNNGINLCADMTGTAKIVLAGGTWVSSFCYLSNNLDINGNVKIVGDVYYNSNTIKYVSGIVTATGSTLNIGGSCTLDLNGCSIGGFRFLNGVTVTLASNLLASGLVTVSANSILNGSSYSLTSSGGFLYSANLSGTAKIVITGGTFSSTGGTLVNNLDINGNVTFSGSFTYNTGTITYISGTVVTTGSTLLLTSTTTLNTSTMEWGNITTNNAFVITLSSNLNVRGLFSVTVVGITINGSSFSAILYGGVSVSNSITGTAKIVLAGGTWSATSTNSISNNLDINGNVTVSGTVNYASGTINYVSGTVTTTGSTLNITGACTISTGSLLWNNIIPNGYTVTLSSTLRSTTLSIANFHQTFAGSFGFDVDNLTITSTIGYGLNLKDGVTYRVRNSITSKSAPYTFYPVIASSSGTIKAILNLDYGCSTNLACDFIRINASGGRPIYTFGGTITDCVNINRILDLKTIASGYSSVMS